MDQNTTDDLRCISLHPFVHVYVYPFSSSGWHSLECKFEPCSFQFFLPTLAPHWPCDSRPAGALTLLPIVGCYHPAHLSLSPSSSHSLITIAPPRPSPLHRHLPTHVHMHLRTCVRAHKQNDSYSGRGKYIFPRPAGGGGGAPPATFTGTFLNGCDWRCFRIFVVLTS